MTCCPECAEPMAYHPEGFLCPLLPADHRPILDPPEVTGEALVWDRWECPGHHRTSQLRRLAEPVARPEAAS
jgi:hypothetical protein